VEFMLRGLGMIGTSMGLALAGEGRRIGYDPDPRHAALALARGAVDALTGDPQEAAEVVLLCGPPQAVLADVARPLPGAALVLDVASVKVPVMAAVHPELPFVGGHPLAGREHSGPEAGEGAMFRGQPFFLVPALGREELLPMAERIVQALGALPVRVGAEEHDAMLALTSHLPYLLARSLIRAAAELPEVAKGPGFASMTRPGLSPEALWQEILALNRGPVREAWRRLQAEVEAALNAAD
jgi:prephenate dehydrogenase